MSREVIGKLVRRVRTLEQAIVALVETCRCQAQGRAFLARDKRRRS